MTRTTDSLRRGVLAKAPALLLDRLEAIAELEQEAREIGRDLVLAGQSYADLGRLLGITRQSARERFAPAVDAYRRVYGDVMPWDDRVPPELLVSEADWLAGAAGSQD